MFIESRAGNSLKVVNLNSKKKFITRMWAGAQCYDHPAEYRWRPL